MRDNFFRHIMCVSEAIHIKLPVIIISIFAGQWFNFHFLQVRLSCEEFCCCYKCCHEHVILTSVTRHAEKKIKINENKIKKTTTIIIKACSYTLPLLYPRVFANILLTINVISKWRQQQKQSYIPYITIAEMFLCVF